MTIWPKKGAIPIVASVVEEMKLLMLKGCCFHLQNPTEDKVQAALGVGCAHAHNCCCRPRKRRKGGNCAAVSNGILFSSMNLNDHTHVPVKQISSHIMSKRPVSSSE